MKQSVFPIVCLLLIGRVVFAADDDKTKASVRTIGLAISKPSKVGDSDQIASFNPGTTVDVVITQPGKFILGIDPKASKLTAFTDDKKTDLSKRPSTFGREWLNASFLRFNKETDLKKTTSAIGREWLNASFLRFNKDNSECAFQVYAPNVPVEDAERILVQATIAVLCGKEEKTAEQKDLSLKVGQKATLGSISLTVQKGYPEGKQITVALATPERSIKSVEFLDSKGKTIKQNFTNTFMMFNNMGKPEYQTSCSLPVPSEPVTVKVVYFSKTETINVPVDLKIGVGF